MADVTTRLGLPFLEGSDPANDIDQGFEDLAEALDDVAVVYEQGTLASRPTSSPGTPGVTGRFYFATDTADLYYDKGTGWLNLAELLPDGGVTAAKLDDTTVLNKVGVSSPSVVRGGSLYIPGSESTQSTSYVTLTTPDQIDNVVLPTDGYIEIAFHALVKRGATSTTLQAAIFLDSTQVQVASINASTGAHSLAGQAAGRLAGTSGLTFWTPLYTTGAGLNIYTNAVAESSDASVATTGQVMGHQSDLKGGRVLLFAAAGTYDVSVRFSSSNASVPVSAKERRLHVRALV